MSQWGLAYSTNGIIGILFFTIRSVFCSISSTSLMLLHLVQIALRTTRMVYNLIEIVLSRCCAIVNDCSLLSIDVIRAARVNHGEKTFTQLADKGPFGQGDGQNEWTWFWENICVNCRWWNKKIWNCLKYLFNFFSRFNKYGWCNRGEYWTNPEQGRLPDPKNWPERCGWQVDVDCKFFK